jgi:uncharacterized protein Smg (DUF494 family)
MTYHALLEYIRQAKDCGASDDEIMKRLTDAGWYTVDVQDVLQLYRKLTEQKPKTDACEPVRTPKPSLAERIAPRYYDSHLIAVASVAFAIGFVGYLLIVAW